MTTCKQIKKMMENEHNIFIIDLRSPQHFAEGHIDNSYNIPFAEISQIERWVKDKKAKIFLFCENGQHSRSAQMVLQYLGYNYVINAGAINDWPYGFVR